MEIENHKKVVDKMNQVIFSITKCKWEEHFSYLTILRELVTKKFELERKP